MSWFDFFGKNDGDLATETVFKGDLESTNRKLPGIPDAIEKIMNFCVNQHRSDGTRAFSQVGEKVVFKMNGVVFGVRDDEETEIGGGDFEIEIRRVR